MSSAHVISVNPQDFYDALDPSLDIMPSSSSPTIVLGWQPPLGASARFLTAAAAAAAAGPYPLTAKNIIMYLGPEVMTVSP